MVSILVIAEDPGRLNAIGGVAHKLTFPEATRAVVRAVHSGYGPPFLLWGAFSYSLVRKVLATVLVALTSLVGSADAGPRQHQKDNADRLISERAIGSGKVLAKLRYGLATGPNGPIPAIVVDQFGYLRAASKIAVLRDPQVGYDSSAKYVPASKLEVVDVTTGIVVHTGAPVQWNGGNTDPISGDRAWWFDFSNVTRSGRYIIRDSKNQTRSPEFNIGERVYNNVLKRALKMFFYQRAGAEKSAAYAGAAWADTPSHLGPEQDRHARHWPGAQSLFQPGQLRPRNLSGGWYDAGDYNKYTNWTARNILVLLQAYEENPDAFDDDVGIPESKNGTPDVLDEIKWGLDWLVRMQNADGSVLCVQGLATGTPPSAATEPSYFGPATTSASLMTAAVFARASKIYGELGHVVHKEFADDLARRALAAWKWAIDHPAVLYWNNDESRQPGSAGLAHGQQELSDSGRALAKFEAAVNLYEITGEMESKRFAESYSSELMTQDKLTLWQIDSQDAALRFATIKGLSKIEGERIQSSFLASLSPQAENFGATIRKTDPYRAPLTQYTWGSNKAKAMQARQFQLVAKFASVKTQRQAAKSAALEYLHYIHGVNPLGLVYLTNMAREGASNSAKTIFHSWFAKGTRWQEVAPGKPGPPSGFLVGGPNQYFKLDSCCSGERYLGLYYCYNQQASEICSRGYSPPIGQPPAKSYLQFNDGWPANSWEVTEPSTSYQAYYIRLLATNVR